MVRPSFKFLETLSDTAWLPDPAWLPDQGAAASRIGEDVRQWLNCVRSGCLEHVWDELLVGIMRSSDVLVLVTGFGSHFQLSRSSGNKYASTS